MKVLRWVGAALMVVGLGLLLTGLLGKSAPVGGDFRADLRVKDRVITGAYKSYGVEDGALPLWLAKTVFRNDTGQRITNLRVRYRVGEYADWCAWHNYPAVDPTQTVVDLYHPIFSSSIARLTSRAPAELQMEYEYTDGAGRPRQSAERRAVTMLSRHEFLFSDLTAEERTSAFQDQDTNSPLMAAWVSRQDDPVARLASMANKRAGGLGASSSNEDCIKVMEQIYEIMRTIHISYQHPQAMQDAGMSYDIKLVQSLQYPRDTIQKKSGTCIDLAILYAAMLNSVNIEPFLVSMDGHCFPMARLPGGQFLPVEATGVGDGYENGMTFAQAVESGMKTWNQVQQTGRFNLVDVRQCWTAGVPNPELDPLPPDILERWGIVQLVEAGGRAAPVIAVNEQVPAPQPTPTPAPIASPEPEPAPIPTPTPIPTPPQPQPQPQPQRINLVGQWTFAVTAPTGQVTQGVCQIATQGNQVILVASASYQMLGADGLVHQFQEQNQFVGTLSGQRLSAVWAQGWLTMDGWNVPPPAGLRLDMTVSPDGRQMQGQVSAVGGAAPIVMQKQQ